jgi:hypothetical protein
MTYPIPQPADNAAPYTYTEPIRNAIAGVNDHQTRLTTLESTAVNSTTIDNVVTLANQAAYDALGTKVATTLYAILS